jgi:glutamate synthase domain-containing protein 1
VTLHAPDDQYDWRALEGELGAAISFAEPARYYCNHAVLTLGASQQEFFDWLDDGHRELGTFGFGERIEVFKDVGLPDAVARRFDLAHRSGTHALGHTRMATESAVTTEHSHPFSTGLDLCLVHNGSLSNHNRVRQSLRREGIRFATDNDTEVAAGYLTWRLAQGMSLTQALETALADLDGFYTFAVGTRDGFAILRDQIACKPAVLAETGDWVAMATEYRAIATLPGAAGAEIWEPRPATVYSWQRQ